MSNKIPLIFPQFALYQDPTLIKFVWKLHNTLLLKKIGPRGQAIDRWDATIDHRCGDYWKNMAKKPFNSVTPTVCFKIIYYTNEVNMAEMYIDLFFFYYK